MSNLKHQSPEELRKTISWCQRVRAKHRADKEAKQSRIAQLESEVAEHGKLDHNIGQKEAWARFHLAQKETDQ